ncbi:hypothetical protein BCR35DRAFT_33843 [Leucosporidium creatinivorum]|uniref:Uncharacterized protein n=1 Tax=Leucosporidium creatinivorum TaxID=106004 RepID=A0A1Y2CGQ0_9BASI|nr:hypothetical protein BCR35DRAFT_33843 [Leucosporidium creatinivorum]
MFPASQLPSSRATDRKATLRRPSAQRRSSLARVARSQQLPRTIGTGKSVKLRLQRDSFHSLTKPAKERPREVPTDPAASTLETSEHLKKVLNTLNLGSFQDLQLPIDRQPELTLLESKLRAPSERSCASDSPRARCAVIKPTPSEKPRSSYAAEVDPERNSTFSTRPQASRTTFAAAAVFWAEGTARRVTTARRCR